MNLNRDLTSGNLVQGVRRWQRVSAFLVLVILGLGGFSAYLLRSLDAHYSELIDGSLPVLNELRMLGNDAMATQRAMLNGLLAENAGARADAIARAQQSLDAGGRLRRSLKAKLIFDDDAAGYGLLARAGESYASAVGNVLERLNADRVAEADALRRNQTRPALDSYLERIDVSARYVESHSQAVNDRYTDSARSRSVVMVVLASLPLIVAGLALLVVGALLVVMMLMFRRLGSDDVC